MTTAPQPSDNGDEPTARIPGPEEITTPAETSQPETEQAGTEQAGTEQAETEREVAEGPFGDGILGDDGGRTNRMPSTPKPQRKLSATSIVIAVLVGLMGFALVVQV